MEFKQITITNFLSYFGKNKIDFSPFTTIVIGQNNTGKSKLFDAINFVLYGRIYDTQKESWITDDTEIANLILNKHEVNEALEKNKTTTESSVSIEIDDLVIADTQVTITRSFIFKILNGKYVFSSKNLTLTETDKFVVNSYSYLGSDANERMKMYFSDSIKDFFLFQGEAASKIMKLQKNGNFRMAVREVARLEVFEKARDYAEKYEDTISRSIQIKAGKNKKVKNEQEKLQSEIENLIEQEKKYQKNKDEAETKLAEYQEVLDKNNDELSKLKEFEDYFKQKKALEENKKNIQRQIKEIGDEKFAIIEDSVFYKVREKIASFKTFYEKLEAKGEVPPSISANEIKKALKACQCTICGTDLSEGTPSRKFAETRLPKCDTDKLGNYLRALNYTIGDMEDEIRNIPSNLNNLLERKRKSDTRKQNLINDEKRLAEQLENTNLDESASVEKMKHIAEVKQTVSRYESLCKNAERDFNSARGSINVIENQIFQARKQLGNLVADDDEVDEEDKIKLHYASKLNAAMKRLFETANTTAYEQVEQKANEYYKEMTHENAALVGDIKIDLETSEIYTVDEDGVRIMDINQGNRISIQLAVIAGILTVAQEQFGVQYPFVTDAPVSHLGGDNKTSTIQTMINAFEQSIIIIKDDTSTKNKSNDEIRKLINESSDIEKAYELSLSKAENINDQFTVIKQIKG